MEKTAAFFLALLTFTAPTLAATKTPLETNTSTDTPTVPFVNAGTASNGTASTALGLKVNGTEYMRVTATGSIGIGTTEPQTTLDVKGALHTGAKTIGTSCSPEGAIAYDTTDHLVVYCSNVNQWAPITSSQPTGTLCGFSMYYKNAFLESYSTPCDGRYPEYQGCPDGYTSTRLDTFLDGNNELRAHYTCMKS